MKKYVLSINMYMKAVINMKEIKVFNIYRNTNKITLNRIVNELLSDNIYLSSSFPTYKYNDKLWYENPLNNRSYTFMMQCLAPISYLLAYFDMYDKNTKYVDKALDLFYLWYENNFLKNKNDYTFNKHSLALRLISICDLYTTVNQLEHCILEDVFMDVISHHCHFLNEEENYKKYHMNGINQDIALYIAGIVFNRYFNDIKYLEYKELAIKRLTLQINHLINEDGSYREHNLQHAYLLFVRLSEFYQSIKDYEKESDLCNLLKDKLDKLVLFLYVMLEPKGYLPPIGDSSYLKVNNKYIFNYDHKLKYYFEYLISNGKHGKKLLYLNTFFPQSNYLISINKRVINTHFTKLIFYCPTHSTTHKHNDDLSFLLYYKNTLIFLDGGKYNYQYDSFYRRAVMSIYAHNTICVDKHDYLIDMINTNKSAITNVSYVDNILLAQGVSCLYDEVLIKRNMVFVKNYSLLILDEIKSKNKHDYEFIFNINPNVYLRKVDKLFNGYLDDEKIFGLETLYSDIDLNAFHYYGDNDEYKGWFSKNVNEIEPSHCVIYHGKAKNAKVITQIAFNKSKEISINIDDDTVVLKINDDTYSIKTNNYSSDLYKNYTLIKNYYNANDTLLKSMAELMGGAN